MTFFRKQPLRQFSKLSDFCFRHELLFQDTSKEVFICSSMQIWLIYFKKADEKIQIFPGEFIVLRFKYYLEACPLVEKISIFS